MKLLRRDFLKYGTQASGLAGLSSLGFKANGDTNTEPHFLMVLRVNGGWDLPMAMDSRPISTVRSLGLTDNQYPFETVRSPVKDHQTSFLGESMRPLFPKLQDLAIINGMMMNHKSSIHEQNRYYSASGTLEESSGMFPIQLAKLMSQKGKQKIGYQLEYESFPLAGYTDVIPLSGIGNEGGNNSGFLSEAKKSQERLDQALRYFMESDDREGFMNQLLKSLGAESTAIQRFKALAPTLKSSFMAGRKEMEFVGTALAGFASNYMQMAVVDIIKDPELDSHSGHISKQSEFLKKGMELIGQVIDRMKATPYFETVNGQSKSLFDLTTVAVTCEFSRTAYGSYDGTEHNQFCNSMMLFGKGIKGNSVIGRSNVYPASMSRSGQSMLHAVPFDFNGQRAFSLDEEKQFLARTLKIGTCNSNGCFGYIHPETVWRTVGQLFGYSKMPALKDGPLLKALLKT